MMEVLATVMNVVSIIAVSLFMVVVYKDGYKRGYGDALIESQRQQPVPPDILRWRAHFEKHDSNVGTVSLVSEEKPCDS